MNGLFDVRSAASSDARALSGRTDNGSAHALELYGRESYTTTRFSALGTAEGSGIKIMARYHTKKEILEDSDLSIELFFKSSTFTGVFSPSVPDTIANKGAFCGSITEILINGEEYYFAPPFILLPNKFSSFVKEGKCSFQCYIDIDALRSEKHSIRFRVARIKNEKVNISVDTKIDEAELKTLMDNLKLKNKSFIGKFNKNTDGSFKISDIRRTSDFSKLIVQNKKEVTPISYHPKSTQPEEGKYYEFSWILTNVQKDKWVYNFKLDESKPIKEIRPYDIIKILYHTMKSANAGDGQRTVKTLEMLKTQLTASGKEIFIYELLQNANDYPVLVDGKKQKVDVKFHITDDSLLFMHTGAIFNEKNIAAICNINDGEKKDNTDAIGYKGIGFKTVFLDNNYVYIQSGGFSFRFDEEHTKDMVDTPWQILPIWTDFKELTASERYLFTNAPKDYRVKLALRPSNKNTLRIGSKSYVNMFRELFKDPRSILFIPNISSVTVDFGRYSEPINCQKDTNKWLINEYVADIPEEITQTINDCLEAKESTLKIPEKYKDFKKTKVSFACETDGVRLKAVENSILYCYLPTIKAKWGLKFLMNTDMIPTGPRDNIEVEFDNQFNLNELISGIAGEKFAYWINDLCKERRFVATSVFELIPNFDIMLRSGYENYNGLIKAFSEGFLKSVEEIAFIPTEDKDFALLADTILDESGLIDEGIMTESEMCKILDIDAKLPLQILRESDSFNSFQKRYLKKLDKEENICKCETIEDLIESEEFSEWYIGIEEKRKIAFLTWLETNGLSSYINDLPIFNFDGEWRSANSISDKPLYVITRESTKDITNILNKLGFKTSDNTLEDLPLWTSIDYRSDDSLLDDIIAEAEDTILTAEEKLRLFCNKFCDVGEEILSSVRLFTNTHGVLCALEDMCAPYDGAPDYIQQFIINEDEYNIVLDDYLVSEEDRFEKIVWDNLDEISVSPKELYNDFKWTDSKYTSQLIKSCDTDDELYEILPIIEKDGAKQPKIDFIDQIESLELNGNAKYSRDSIESRIISLALDVLEDPSELSSKIVFNDVPLDSFSYKDEVVCKYIGPDNREKRVIFSLQKLLPTSTENTNLITQFKSSFTGISESKLDKFFSAKGRPLAEIVSELESLLQLKPGYWPTGCGNAHQYLFDVYYWRQVNGYTSSWVLNIKLAEESEEFVNEFMDFLFDNRLDIKTSPFTYRVSFEGFHIPNEYTLPSEQIIPAIAKWASTPEKVSYLRNNGVYSCESKKVVFRKAIINNEPIRDYDLTKYQFESSMDFFITKEGIELPFSKENQRDAILKTRQQYYWAENERADIEILKANSVELDTPEYKEWRKKCILAIFKYNGEIPYTLAYNSVNILAYNEGNYFYQKTEEPLDCVLYVNGNIDLSMVLHQVVAENKTDFVESDFQQLFVYMSKSEQERLTQLDNTVRTLEEEKSAIERELEQYKQKYGELQNTKTTNTQPVSTGIIETPSNVPMQKVAPQSDYAEIVSEHTDTETANKNVSARTEWEQDINSLLGNGNQLSDDEVMDENLITRWRVYNYLRYQSKQYTIDPSFDEDQLKDYVAGRINVIPLSDGRIVVAQGAKGGIWYISPNVWRGFESSKAVVCLCTGNDDNDFVFADSLEDIEEYANTANVLIKVSPKNDYSMMDSIKTLFPGEDNYKMNIHLMVKVHNTNNKLVESIFDNAFNQPEDYDLGI